MSLEAAAQLLAKDEGEAALEAMVEVWRGWPSPELAELIDVLAAQLSAALPPVTGAGTTSDRKAFEATARAQRTATLPRLFEALPKSNGPIARERVFALSEWPVNPAISAGIQRWLEQPPFEGRTRARCFPPAVQVLAKHRDPRAAPLLQKLTTAAARSTSISHFGLAAWAPLVALAKEAKAWPQARAATLAEAKTLQALRAAIAPKAKSTREVEPLVARIYADPDDDAPRMVLADLLQEAGDPRGELIALQLARAASGDPVSKREKQLIGTWGRDWLGPLNPALMRDGVVFERGFVSRGAYNGVLLPGLADLREWATVTHLEVTHARRTALGSAHLLLSPAMTSLRHVIGAGHRDLPAIAENGAALPWESLTCALWSFDSEGAARLVYVPLPALRHLGVLGDSPGPLSGLTPDRVAALLDTPLGKRLHHLEVAARPPAFGALVDLCSARKLTRLTVRPTSRALSLTWDLSARGVVIDLDPPSGGSLEAVEAALRSVRPGVIDRALLKVAPRAVKRLSLGGLKAALGGVRLELR